MKTVKKIKVWDILVRFTHWAVAIGILANLAITEDGSTWHEYVGYTVVGLVAMRLLWGLIGTKYARFSNFFPTPKRIKTHLKTFKNKQMDENHLGHNPFGALMMFALWGVIIVLGVSGYLMGTDQFWGVDEIEEIHEILANSLYVLVPVHVLSAIVMGKLQRQNLVKAMITGNKTVLVDDTHQDVSNKEDTDSPDTNNTDTDKSEQSVLDKSDKASDTVSADKESDK